MKISKIFKGFLVIVAASFIWQACATFNVINTSLLPSPKQIIIALAKLFQSTEIYNDILSSLWRVTIGFVLAAFLGILVGFLFGSFKNVKMYFNPVLEILRPIPPIAFIPIAILWFGIGNGPAYFLVCFGAFFPIFTSTYFGVVNVKPIHTNAALWLGATRKMLIFDVILPSAAPYIVAGLKTGIGVAWFCVIAAELVGAQSGLGYMIQLNRLTLQSANVFAGMVIIGVIGYMMTKMMAIIQNKIVPWSSKLTA